ncbi:ATP-binding protein [Azospirillum agricola]|uniref:ATP-binding protein n=1 Tax=Azospirillum agricola TaxID=1720247 RepID=UPI000A0F2A94|nr:ATP-binding protein [Azospirillum agricola]SMH47900.1 hypothetical protein SAMN02982994_2676 [Azospirillum lipoferum]
MRIIEPGILAGRTPDAGTPAGHPPGGWDRCRFLTYAGATSDADLREEVVKPACWVSGVQHVVCGLEVPHLPEPFAGALTGGSRAEILRQNRRRFHDQFGRVVGALYTPAVYRANAHEWDVGHHVFDIRLLNSAVGARDGAGGSPMERLGSVAPTQLRLLILVRVAVRLPSGSPPDEARLRALGRAVDLARKACRQIRALAPRELTLRDIHWAFDTADSAQCPPGPAAGRDDSVQCWLTPGQAWLGPAEEGLGIADIRRSYALNVPLPPLRRDRYMEQLQPPAGRTGDALYALPVPLPATGSSLMATLAALTSTSRPAGLCLRLQPTIKTDLEAKAMHERLKTLMDLGIENAATRHLAVTLLQEELFQAAIQVASTDADALNEIAASYTGENRPDGPTPVLESPRRFALVSPLAAPERAVAAFNLGFLEFMPWGAVSNELHERTLLAGNRPPPAPGLAFVGQAFALENQEVFLARDAEFDPRLARQRMLITFDEAVGLWRLPVVDPGGQAGVASRLPNPFEQLPEETPDDGDAISMGVVQHRGRATGQHFRLPLIRPKRVTPNLAGVGDRVLMVAGSPGSGKTNFCLSFLGQLWDNRPRGGAAPRAKYPYLVIDPTRGNEFRQVMRYAGDDLLIFTVGDGRCSGFRFNPFIVPRQVSVQTHVSRLMSCFKAAYHMWDPLPAIFEMAIKRAYQGRRRPLWDKRHPGAPWLAAEDFPSDPGEPFPDLDDVIGAMGRGGGGAPEEGPELWSVDGRPTVMHEQRGLWGGQTENAATIVASTFLRLGSLRDSFGHILGVGRGTDPLVDIAKLLERPVVLEMGMVGDSQALSLIMAFLLSCLRGTIETTGPALRGAARAEGGGWLNMLVIEEAHLLLSAEGGGGGKDAGNSKAQAAEDINNMLAEVRKYGQGVMLLDQRPGSLVGGAIDNAYAICMHRLNEERSFAQFSQLLNLSADQQRFARTELRPGEMITLDRRSGLPVLVRPPDEGTSDAKLDDASVREAMLARREAVRLEPAPRPDPGPAPGPDPNPPERPPAAEPDLPAAIVAHGLGERFGRLRDQVAGLPDEPPSGRGAWTLYDSAGRLRWELGRHGVRVSTRDVLALAVAAAGRPDPLTDALLAAVKETA